jgi:hypothetical protein
VGRGGILLPFAKKLYVVKKRGKKIVKKTELHAR